MKPQHLTVGGQAPSTTVATRSPHPGVSLSCAKWPSTADVLFLAVLLGFMLVQPKIRTGSGPLIITVTTAAVYGLALAPRRIIASLAVFTAVGGVWVLLSYVDALPDAWTYIYNSAYIPRQAFYVAAFYPLTLAFFALWYRALGAHKQLLLLVMIALAACVGEIVASLALSNPVMSVASLLVGGLGNARMPIYMAVFYMLIVRFRENMLSKAATFLLIAVAVALVATQSGNPQLQNIVILLLVPAVAVYRPTKVKNVAIIVCILCLYMASSFFALDIYRLDANSGYRLVASRHAIDGCVESWGVGVGYGKEVVRAYLPELGVLRDELVQSEKTLAVQGVHNSFAEEFMRLGVVGGTALMWFILARLFPPMSLPLGDRRMATMLHVTVIMALLLNVGLESPTYMVGVAYAAGFLLAMRQAPATA